MVKLRESIHTFNFILNCIDLIIDDKITPMLPGVSDSEKMRDEAIKYMSFEGEEVSFILPSMDSVKFFYGLHGWVFASASTVAAAFGPGYKRIDYAAGERKGCHDCDNLEELFAESKENVKATKQEVSKKKYSMYDFAQLLADSF